MHMRGTPDTMQSLTDYDDLVADIRAYFSETLQLAMGASGLGLEHFMIDPGIGFAKTAEQNLQLVRAIRRFRDLGRPVLMGPSRKSFIGKILDGRPPADRVWGTAAAVAACVLNGADVVRVHDVAEMRDVVDVSAALRRGRLQPG
jgi:dihydropteroate synthase